MLVAHLWEVWEVIWGGFGKEGEKQVLFMDSKHKIT